jgi:hypothetical protein
MKQKNFPQNIAEVVLGKKVKSCTRSCLFKVLASHVREPHSCCAMKVLQSTYHFNADFGLHWSSNISTDVCYFDRGVGFIYFHVHRVKVGVPDE